jgi:hypothetical protein
MPVRAQKNGDAMVFGHRQGEEVNGGTEVLPSYDACEGM